MTTAARVRRHRARVRAGLVVFRVHDEPVLVDEVALEALLVRHGVLPGRGAKDPGELADALTTLLSRLIAADST